MSTIEIAAASHKFSQPGHKRFLNLQNQEEKVDFMSD
jgi:hypothetical protein